MCFCSVFSPVGNAFSDMRRRTCSPVSGELMEACQRKLPEAEAAVGLKAANC